MSYYMHLKQIFITKKILRCVFFAGVPALLFYGLSLAGLVSAGFDLLQILRDPAQQTGQSSFLGFVSNIGVWLWVSSAAICFFIVITGDMVTKNGQRELLFLAGMLSIILAFDDFFMIHDRYINERICYVAYAFIAGTLLIRHFKLIIEIEGFAFLLACSLLMLSILTDLIQLRIPIQYDYTQVFEEGFKFIGAATWLYFISKVAYFRPPFSKI